LNSSAQLISADAPEQGLGAICGPSSPCPGCTALLAECGSDAELFDFYSHRLLRRGWAGKSTDAERRFLAAHAPWARHAAAVGATHILRSRAVAAKSPHTGAEMPSADSFPARRARSPSP
jgi:hypothetical protein